MILNFPRRSSGLATNTAFGLVQKWNAEPEAKLCFDAFPGEPRNSDVIVNATDTFGAFLIAVEAKADESFGETVANALAAAVERHVDNPNSNGVVRIQQLAAAGHGKQVKCPSGISATSCSLPVQGFCARPSVRDLIEPFY